jgi:hypothetical protein
MAKRMNNFSMLINKDLHGVQVSNTAKTIAVGQCCISIYMANMLACGSMHPNCVCVHLELLCLSVTSESDPHALYFLMMQQSKTTDSLAAVGLVIGHLDTVSDA